MRYIGGGLMSVMLEDVSPSGTKALFVAAGSAMSVD